MGNLISERYENKVDVRQPVAVTGTTGGEGGTSDASASNQLLQITAADLTNTRIGTVTETAPASDTASSGLNGRLQRIAQRITSLIALLPAALGQTTKSASLPVTIASDQDTLAISPRANGAGTGGTTPFKLIAAGSTNATSVKASAGNLYSIVAIGLTANVRYLKLYNKASSPTVGTDVPVMTIPIPGNTQGAGVSIPFSMGVNFGTGIALAITTGAADADTGAVTASDVIINLTYA